MTHEENAIIANDKASFAEVVVQCSCHMLHCKLMSFAAPCMNKAPSQNHNTDDAARPR